MYKKYNLNTKLNIQVDGGNLTINADKDWQEVWLSGPAEITEYSQINIGAINEG